jgi:adenylyltransferase/sulfurtransferase
MNSISAQAFKENLDAIAVLDIRTQREWDDFNVGGIHSPLDDLLARINEISQEKNYTLICYNGTQSQIESQLLAAKGFENCQNLEGGLEAFLSL